MIFAWDEAKRQRNVAKHDLDFLDARALFDGRPVITVRSTHPTEERYLTVGLVEGRFVTVVWTRPEEAIRIISARRSRHAQRQRYEAVHN